MNKRISKVPQIAMVLFLFCAWTVIAFDQKDTPQQTVNKAAQAYGNQWKGDKIRDWVGVGKISRTGDKNGPLDFTLTVKSKDKVKRVVRTSDGSKVLVSIGSDGKKSWHSSGPFTGNATGNAAHFIDSHTIRSLARLFDDGNALTDLGPADAKHAPESASSKVIEAKNGKGASTRYYIDNTNSLVTRLEFETGAFYTMLFSDKKFPAMHSLVFSDYRQVNGIPTPFKIAVYEGLTKIEEMNFTSVQYNTGVTDDAFVP
jgi:hypothetical protein